MKKPFSIILRPKNFYEFVGHKEILTESFKEKIRKGDIPHIIMWGPPGSGKTTLSEVIKNESNLNFVRVSGAESGIKELRVIIDNAKKEKEFFQKETILFIDEIHRLDRKEQDFLLSFVENRDIILIGATTENPYFTIVSPLLSRCFLIILKPYDYSEMNEILERSLKYLKNLKIDEDTKKFLIEISYGDARFILNVLDSLKDEVGDKEVQISYEDINRFLSTKKIKFDKREEHYNLISALIKSIRGSDADAALYYLFRLVEGGEDLRFITRRLIILASEDIGLSDPTALVIANSGAEAVERVGLPEAKLILSEVVLYLSKAPKDNRVLRSMENAIKLVEKFGELPVPLHLRNPVLKGLENLGWGKGYKYPHNHKDEKIEYLPDEIKDIKIFEDK
ncbi:MAG TPA: replication-associated recombination protein A [Caldisericia bacterium]|nr:replication-associated recombination protein A [Caldisericia bacterium]HPB33160.1 replication-associated recombination protein A [Caldisericia bacterium]HQL66348.1 replication-associated recombination protein A [Caldisericia bacterium]HQN48295.1 replication-associated recombination protein A [Caldisericia bacterium]HQO99003.1 replication-associated recombination protein A [Caldisericia bacterium]